MQEPLSVEVSGALRVFLNEQVGEHGLYESVNEYIRALIRSDFERSEQQKWMTLYNELSPALHAESEAFLSTNATEIKHLGRGGHSLS